ncbi:DNA-binding transcriptional LysR family regulator [Tahibacter aquaticus]|uniref:DNA-binding transcriptional LysR family regulator n=1 Tax=Tahibacter aquaticus TaxID=520092 RepID=A0A4V3DL50_9GAMM|nr:LysR substrate-binding domain-containing protein [Tahibacter aquaticus]TDR37835.1 DNA-binding transcriptional LysR family regulator [Tahibacter aquaticus]
MRVDRASEMEAFDAVVRSGSLSAAGRALGLTPSALSRILSRIEQRLGVRLLIRTTRALTLTPEGKAYHLAAQRILADLDESEGAIAYQAAPRGRLRVSVGPAYGRLVIVPLLAEFVARYPEILVDISLSDALVDILAGQTDVAIRFGPLADSPLTARRLGSNGRTIVASPAYLARAGTPQVPQDLARHNCLNFNFRRAEPSWPFRQDGRDYVLDVSGNIEANNGETLAQLALQGSGIARLGSFHVDAEVAAGNLVALLEKYNPGDTENVHALFVGGASTPRRVRVFVDFLLQRLAPPDGPAPIAG